MPRLYRFGLLMLAAAIIGYFVKPAKETTITDETGAQSPEKSSVEKPSLQPNNQAVAPALVVDQSNRDNRFIRYTNGTVHLKSPMTKSRKINSATHRTSKDLELLDEIFASYRTVFNANPVGSENSEFTAALLGDNPKKVVFFDPESPHIKDGELVDRWGQPFYFHPVSAEELDIQSSGPDKKLWTSDDVKE